MTDKRNFPIGVVLGVTTGRLLSDFGSLHEFIEYLAGEPVWTHELGRVCKEAAPAILADHPRLAEIDPDTFTKDNWQARLEAVSAEYGAEFAIRPLSKDQHESIDPISEAAEFVHPDKIIVVRK